MDLKITFLDKLIELIVEKGIGGFLAPWQIERIGRANTKVKLHETLTLAQAESLESDIRQGKLTYENGKLLRAPIEANKQISNGTTNSDVQVETFILKQLGTRILEEELRKDINVTKALEYTYEELKDNESMVPEIDVTADWLNRWREKAANISDEEMQSLWGRILAGEIISPGSYSFRTIEFLNNLNSSEARKIEDLLACCTSEGEILIGEAGETVLFSFEDLQNFEDLGILKGASSGGYAYSNEAQRISLVFNDRKLILDKLGQPIHKVVALRLTLVGKELSRLCRKGTNNDYLLRVSDYYKSKGYDVRISNAKTDIHAIFGGSKSFQTNLFDTKK